MSIDVFDEFPLPKPPLVDDPFASLSASDIAATEPAPDAEASGNEYKEDEEGEDNDNNERSLLRQRASSFHFLVS
jgi:hypothetical protein